ncbi:MAG: hypothetical protein WBF79_14170 [Rhodococcus sp. (in: high G+C Gram-positive bacteria)]
MGSPNGERPASAYQINTVAAMQDVDPQAFSTAGNVDMQQALEGIRGNLFLNLLGGFLNIPSALGSLLNDIGLAITSGPNAALTGVLGAINSFVSDLKLLGDEHTSLIDDLQDKTQNLAGVIGYGCSTQTGAQGGAGGGKFVLPFTTQIGPIVGVTRSTNGFVLGSKGLWRVDAMQFFDFYTLGSNQVDMDIRVYAPDGSLFLQRFNHNENAGANTLTSLVSFVVPAAGYRVEVWAQAALGRGILGGNAYSSLNVTKISDETD